MRRTVFQVRERHDLIMRPGPGLGGQVGVDPPPSVVSLVILARRLRTPHAAGGAKPCGGMCPSSVESPADPRTPAGKRSKVELRFATAMEGDSRIGGLPSSSTNRTARKPEGSLRDATQRRLGRRQCRVSGRRSKPTLKDRRTTTTRIRPDRRTGPSSHRRGE